ncbi:hypothetical protein AYI68_g4030 [Smittium mucronatum]|uniref:Uncharacterized protein n=1 Tax=Smittium mucronatum TaxID=133383 RepID=A0A1R0GY90_9FUNG|nr:hypothetical protein AYI68_g4030 [Smittium mucronatum]
MTSCLKFQRSIKPQSDKSFKNNELRSRNLLEESVINEIIEIESDDDSEVEILPLVKVSCKKDDEPKHFSSSRPITSNFKEIDGDPVIGKEFKNQ